MALVDGLSHLLVQVTDLDRSEAFYHEVFGFDLVGRDLVAEEGPNALLKSNSGHMILLVQVEKVRPFRPNSSSIHHAFYLTPEQHARARERRAIATGKDVSDTRASFRANGQLSFDVFDPDGRCSGGLPGATTCRRAEQKGPAGLTWPSSCWVKSGTHLKSAGPKGACLVQRPV